MVNAELDTLHIGSPHERRTDKQKQNTMEFFAQLAKQEMGRIGRTNMYWN